MLYPLGRSVYLTNFEKQKSSLSAIAASDTPIFLSLHISEEFSDEYCQKAQLMCDWLYEKGFFTIADVSKKTSKQFECSDLHMLASKLHISAFRIDYGFDVDEIYSLAGKMPVVVNASTTLLKDASKIASAGKLAMAMHNFYPRPETGLDEQFLSEKTQELQKAGLKILSFIVGDGEPRGPVFCGLPTLENHRNIAPSAAFVDSLMRFNLDGIFVGDPYISHYEEKIIRHFIESGTILLPTYLKKKYHNLYGKKFTNRPDSPNTLIRFMESREYSCHGRNTLPDNCIERTRGSITMDNAEYGRYSGEIQLALKNYPSDNRVNVIGNVSQKHLLLADRINKGNRFCLIPPNKSLTDIGFN